MKIIDVLYEKCAGCGKDIRSDEDLGVKMHGRYFCKDCVLECANCMRIIPKVFASETYDGYAKYFICNECTMKMEQ